MKNKQAWFFLAFFILQTTAFAQSKVEKDTLYERLKQQDINKMTQREYDYFTLIKQREVNAEISSVQKQGVLNGVATYFFNFNYGDKPDEGSEVFVLPEKYGDQWEDVRRFWAAVSSKTLRTIENISDADFEALETRVDEFIKDIRYGKYMDVTKVITDGNGAFSVSLIPGNYYLFGRSAHRTSRNKVENLGQVAVAIEEVRAGQSTFVKLEFLAR